MHYNRPLFLVDGIYHNVGCFHQQRNMMKPVCLFQAWPPTSMNTKESMWYRQICIKQHPIKRSGVRVKEVSFQSPENYFPWCIAFLTSIKWSQSTFAKSYSHLAIPQGWPLSTGSTVVRKQNLKIINAFCIKGPAWIQMETWELIQIQPVKNF